MWQWILSVLTSLSADPQAIDRETPKAAAAVAVAYAAFAPDDKPAPAPAPKPPVACCTDCGGRGYIVHGDGHRTQCPCPPTCKCKSGQCRDGTCPSRAALTPDAPAVPAGRR